MPNPAGIPMSKADGRGRAYFDHRRGDDAGDLMWTPKKLSPEADAALHDLYGFLVNYWGLQLHELPHREMCAVIQKAEEEDAKPYTMLVVPKEVLIRPPSL